jgi:linoleoyl-CoA desaturase
MELSDHFVFWISKVLYIAVFIVVPVYVIGVKETLIGYALISFVTGFVISVVFQLAHVVEDASFHLPDADTYQIENEWAVHQIEATADFATKNKIVSWFTGGLNFQVEHHLFPRISHVHYPKISQLVKETCEQFGVNYMEFPTVFSAVRSHVVHLKHVGQ